LSVRAIQSRYAQCCTETLAVKATAQSGYWFYHVLLGSFRQEHEYGSTDSGPLGDIGHSLDTLPE
jgi:hypothetical protein